MAVPYIFADSTSAIPLANLDSNFAYFANAITVSSGNVGIGTNSPSQKLDVVGSNVVVKSNASSGYGSFYANGATGGQSHYFFGINSTETARISSDAGNYLVFSTGSAASERMRINSSGNVGIGTSSPSAKLSVSDGTTRIDLSPSGGTGYVGTQTNHAVGFITNNTERARIDTNGRVLIATTTAYSDGAIGNPILQWTTLVGVRGGAVSRADSTGTATHLAFVNPNGLVGNITSTGTTTSYGTSSDYRLKHDIAPMTGALAKVAALKPVTYKWNADNRDGEGFIAHELAEVCPNAVTGEKDAVDAEGNPVYQGIDTSFLVATLTAAIQEQQALINELRARVAALEHQP